MKLCFLCDFYVSSDAFLQMQPKYWVTKNFGNEYTADLSHPEMALGPRLCNSVLWAT